MFHGYQKQLFFAAACIRSGLYRQAERHLCRAMGMANIERAEHAKSGIMTALNHVRSRIRKG